ncbi:MAG: hypothetical protein HZC28_20275 [Spirochaetes bacterium]|nr:hypothetical protein [Spirochaetota bacterium]
MIIPLEKLIEYKGNRYELARAMIELARNGKSLLANEAKLNKGKIIPVTIKNIIDGKIKFAYQQDNAPDVDPHAPFLHTAEEYDETKFELPEEPVEEQKPEEIRDEKADDGDDMSLQSEKYDTEGDEEDIDIDDEEEIDEDLADEDGEEAAAAGAGDDAKTEKKAAKKTTTAAAKKKPAAKKTVKKAAPKKAKK